MNVGLSFSVWEHDGLRVALWFKSWLTEDSSMPFDVRIRLWIYFKDSELQDAFFWLAYRTLQIFCFFEVQGPRRSNRR